MFFLITSSPVARSLADRYHGAVRLPVRNGEAMTDQRPAGMENRTEDAGAAKGTPPDDRPPPIPIALLIALPACILGLWVVLGLIPFFLASQPGAFGAAFGAVNALFSGLALAGVVVALLLQTRELQYLRQELGQQRGRLHPLQAAWNQTALAQRDSSEALKSQGESLLLASYLQAVAALLDSPAKAKQQKSVDVEQLEAVLQVLQPQVAAIVGIKTETPAETERVADSLERAVREFRGVLEANPLIPGESRALEAVRSALSTLKAELLAVASAIEDSPFLEHAIGHVEELLERSVPTEEGMPEAQNRLARYETAIIQMCSEVQRAARDYRRQSAQEQASPAAKEP
jgi:hypothetical protein